MVPQLAQTFLQLAAAASEPRHYGADGHAGDFRDFFIGKAFQFAQNNHFAELDGQKIFPKPIVTEVTPLKAFYRAEDYHQDYAYYNPDNPYIQVCDRPKIEALKIKIARPVGEDGKLFGSVTAKDIHAAAVAAGATFDKKKMHLKEAIRAIGNFEVPVKLVPGVTANLKVEIVAK